MKDNKFKEITDQYNFNDTLLNQLIGELEFMKTIDTLNVVLSYKDVVRIIHNCIVENINVELCTESIKMGIEQRKVDRKDK